MVNKFKVIEVMNNAMIELLKEKNKNYDINLEIQQNLKDEGYFFKIEKARAFEVLKNVGVKEEKLNNVYKELTDSDVYYDLVRRGKINSDDDSLVVKYKKYIPGELFKK